MARKKLSELTPDELIDRMRTQGTNLEWSLGLQLVWTARAQLRRITGLDNEDIGHLFTSGLTYADWTYEQARQDHDPDITDNPTGASAPTTTEEVIMASKTLTARESIEAAFSAGSEKKLKAAQVIERVLANPKSKISKGTIQTQLHRQSTKKGGWIRKVGPGTFQLVPQAASNGASASAEAKSDPKPTSSRKRSSKKETPKTDAEVAAAVAEAVAS